MERLRRLFTPLDVVSIGFLSVLILLLLIFASRVPSWGLLAGIDLAGICAIVLLAWLAETRKTRFLIGIHRWYSYPIVLLVFTQLHSMVRPIHPVDYDHLLISVDRFIFGTDPTVWLSQFAHPVITEILQIAYFSYYILFIVLGVEIYRRFPVKEFDTAVFFIVYGFYLSYIGYFLLPAVGPRFMLHDFASLDTELPGLFFTTTMRDIINAGEGVTKGMEHPVEHIMRDVFPSGHTQMTMLTVWLAFRYRLRSRGFIATMAGLLIVGTVYLRYHYVVDLFGGAVFFGLTLWTGSVFQRWWRSEPAENGQGSE